MTGHLFVVQADLTRLGCDAVLLPCDGLLDISEAWLPFLPPGLPRMVAGRLRMPREWQSEDGIVPVPWNLGRAPRAYAATTTLSDEDEPGEVVDRLDTAIRALRPSLKAHQGRHLPLLALPLLGAGQGGLRERRGDIISVLLPRLEEASDGIDIALVVLDPRDYAAIQAHRDHVGWADLGTELKAEADRLGRAAGRGQLSLFVGAGVSRPVGVPDWKGLLGSLADRVGESLDENLDLEAQASPLVARLGSDFHDAVRQVVDVEVHALGHALLADLRLQQMVTTNYDRCLEHVLEAIYGADGFRVLTRHLGDASKPWLLKLHGDVAQEGTIVLSQEQYATHEQEYQPSRGVVQGLMLTSHLLFVGFSMADKAFLRLAAAVAAVRRHAEDGNARAGTALSLNSQDVVREGLEDDLVYVAMSETDGVAESARRLEIFLDRLAWTAARTHPLAAQYFLDDRFRNAVAPEDGYLRDALLGVAAALTGNHGEVATVVRRHLMELGSNPAD